MTTTSYSRGLEALESETLPKYQACHQCRKRKMKCDAARPVCGTCSRSHRYAWMRSRDRVNFPPLKDCTYDREPEEISREEEAGLFDMSALEDAIASLESKIKVKSAEANKLRFLQLMVEDDNHVYMNEGQRLLSYAAETYSPTTLRSAPTDPRVVLDPLYTASFPEDYEDGLKEPDVVELSAEENPMSSLFRLTWPEGFPHPELLYHLVDTFFAYFPFANRLLHRPTFETCLALSPSSPDFPQSTLIHAICAVASMYTVYIIRPKRRRYIRTPLSLKSDFMAASSIPSFGEEQCLCSRRALRKALHKPSGMLQGLQAMVLVSWFEYANGRWPRTWQYSGDAINIASTLNLQHACSSLPESRLPCRQYEMQLLSAQQPASSSIEDENRRNCFWSAYALDRMQTVTGGWNTFLNDKWISQCLPTPDETLFKTMNVPLGQRQHIHTADLFIIHPSDQTDSFVLWTKSIILLSLVKAFNRKYPTLIASNEPGCTIADYSSTPVGIEFLKLTDVIHSFLKELPRSHRDPMSTGTLDIPLYMAHIWPHMSLIILHSPHIDSDMLNASAKESLNATRNILQYVHMVQSTSFDLGLLDPWCSIIFYTCAHELMLNAINRANKQEWALAWQLKAEMEVFLDALKQMGERLQVSDRHRQILIQLSAKDLEPLFDLMNGPEVELWTSASLMDAPQLDTEASYDENLFAQSSMYLNPMEEVLS